MRFALFGDIGGHRRLFEEALTRLGVDVDATTIPDGLTVVQVGDLVDRGPDSAGCVALADRFLRACPQRWIQLFGNHEGNRIGGPKFWDEPLEEQASAILERWWADRCARLAVGIRSYGEGELFVSHGGMVAPLWELLGRPALVQAVERINSWVGADLDLAFAAGGMLGRGGIPGPVWPDAGTELYGSWEVAGVAPFGQVHGHSSIGDWKRGALHKGAPRWLRKRAEVDPVSRHHRVTIGGRPFFGIDATLGAETSLEVLSPLVVEGDLVA